MAIGAHFSKKKNGLRPSLKKMALLSEKLKMTEVGPEAVKRTVANKKVLDFKAGLEYYSAMLAGCTCIVTYDRNDFHFRDLEVLNAEDFLAKYVLPFHRKTGK